MSLSKSWINKRFFFVTLKRFWFVGVIYFLALSVIPFSIILFELPLLSRYPNYHIISKDVVLRTQGYCIFVSLLISFALCSLVFNYLHSKDAADYIHSLPPKRISLYISNVLSSLLLLMLPIMINTSILILLKLALENKFQIELNEILIWGLNITALSLLFFSVATCCAIITGTPFVQIFLSFVVLMLPSFLYYTFISNLKSWVFGYYPSPSSTVVEKINPLLRIIAPVPPSSSLKSIEYAAYFSISIFLIVLGAMLYKLRKIESAGQSIVFEFFKHIFRYGAALCGALLVGLYFPYLNQEKYYALAILGYLIASFICFLFAEMILSKRINVFNRSLLRYIYFVIFLLIVIGVIKSDLFGFEKYVPQEEEIQSVVFKDYIFLWNTFEEGNIHKNPEIIKMITNLHREIIRQKQVLLRQKDSNSPFNTTLYITYNLKDGKKIKRMYEIDVLQLSSYLKPLYENHAFKYNICTILKISPSNVKSISFDKYYNYSPASVYQNSKFSIKPFDISEFLKILKNEIYNEKFEDIINQTKIPWGYICIELKKAIRTGKIPSFDVAVPFEKSFTKLEKWLTKKGYIRFARIMPDEISYAIIGKYDKSEKLMDTLMADINFGAIKQVKKIKDNTLIDKYLRLCENPNHFSSYKTSKKEIYYIIFFGKSQRILYVGILKDL